MAIKYVRDGASGAGTNWSDALDDLPSSLTRGDTYYVADGTYAAHTFNDNESGTTLITIKKATIADHGTSTGWLDTYGDGTATWSGRWDFTKGYYLLDGVTRNENSWTTQVYGFRVTCANISYPAGLGGSATTNIEFRYVDAGAPVGTVYNPSDPLWTASEEAFNINNGSGVSTSMVLSHCFLHNTTLIMLQNVNGATIEYCQLKDMWAKEAIRGQGAAKNIVVRYNIFQDTTRDTGQPGEAGTAPIAAWGSDTLGDYDGWQVYGNVFWDTVAIEHSGGVVHLGPADGFPGTVANNCLIYNNTTYNFTGDLSANLKIGGGTGNQISNNIWYNCIGTPVADPNTASNTVLADDIFINAAGGNFRLAENTATGTTLGSPYNQDLDGVTRGGPAAWSRGAFQFTTGGGSGGITNLTVANLIIG